MILPLGAALSSSSGDVDGGWEPGDSSGSLATSAGKLEGSSGDMMSAQQGLEPRDYCPLGIGHLH